MQRLNERKKIASKRSVISKCEEKEFREEMALFREHLARLMALIFIRRTGGARAWPDDWRRRGTFAAKRKRGLTGVVNSERGTMRTETEYIASLVP